MTPVLVLATISLAIAISSLFFFKRSSKENPTVNYYSSIAFMITFIRNGFSISKVIETMFRDPQVKFCYVNFRGTVNLFTSDPDLLTEVAEDIDTFDATTHEGFMPKGSPMLMLIYGNILQYDSEEWRKLKVMYNTKFWSLTDDLLSRIKDHSNTYCQAIADCIDQSSGVLSVKPMSSAQCQWYPNPDEFVKLGQEHCKAIGFASSPLASLSQSYFFSPLIRWLFQEKVEGFYQTFAQAREASTKIYEECKVALKNGADPNERWIYWAADMCMRNLHGMDDEKFILNHRLLWQASTATGYQNTAVLMYFLAKYPEIQQQCLDEVIHVNGDDGPWTEAKLRKLKLMEACINESLRIYHPTSVSNARIATTDVTHKDIFIPKGCNVIPCLASMQLNPNHFPNPKKFDPQRWLQSPSQATIRAFKPFWAGPRACNGRHFAIGTVKILMATILRDYALSLPEDSPYQEELVLDTKFFDSLPDIKIKFHRR